MYLLLPLILGFLAILLQMKNRYYNNITYRLYLFNDIRKNYCRLSLSGKVIGVILSICMIYLSGFIAPILIISIFKNRRNKTKGMTKDEKGYFYYENLTNIIISDKDIHKEILWIKRNFSIVEKIEFMSIVKKEYKYELKDDFNNCSDDYREKLEFILDCIRL